MERCLRDAREKLMESIKLRALEDKWRPMNHVNKNGIARFAEDMNEVGIASIHSWVYGNEFRLDLQNSLSSQFIFMYFQMNAGLL